MAKIRVEATPSHHIDEGIADAATRKALWALKDEHEVASEDVEITLVPAVGPEEWDLHMLEGTDDSGYIRAGRIVLGSVEHPDAVLSWAEQNDLPFVHNVWVAEDLRGKGVARMLFDAYRRHVNSYVAALGPWSPAGYELSQRYSDGLYDDPPEQWDK